MAIESIGDNAPRVKTHPSTDENLTPLTFSEEETLSLILSLTKLRGYCYSHNDKLAKLRGKSIPTITRHIAKFCRLGILTYRRVGNHRWLYPGINDYPMISRRLAQNTKVTKESKSLCQPNEILEEETHTPLLQKTEEIAISPGDIAESDNTPTLPTVAPVEEGNSRGDASEYTPECAFEWGTLIESMIEGVAVCADSVPLLAVAAGDVSRAIRVHTTDSIAHPPAGDNGNHVPTTLSEKGRDNAQNGQSRGIQAISDNRQSGQRTGSTRNAGEGALSDTRRQCDGPRRSKPASDSNQRISNAECPTTGNQSDDSTGDRAASKCTHGSTLETLIGLGVSLGEAARYVAQFDTGYLERCISYYRQQRARGKAKGIGFLCSAICRGYEVKLLDVSPETITKRQVRLRARDAQPVTMGGVKPDMAMLRGRLVGGVA